MEIQASWTDLKKLLTTGSSLKYVETTTAYNIAAVDGVFTVLGYIEKASNPTVSPNPDQVDFETNFKAGANKPTIQTDTDNATFSRTKQAPTGWTYHLRGIEFQTSNPNSLANVDPYGVALTDVTMTLYDSAGAVTLVPASAVRTVIDFEPHHDFYIIGGLAKILATPVSDVRMSVVAVPDVPFAYGGSRVMIQSVNFRFIGSNDKIDADGRASKMLTYSATNHTNKLRFIVNHPAGEQHSIAIFLEVYKI